MPVAEYVTVTRGHASRRLSDAAVPAVRQARESGFVGGHLEGEDLRGTAGRSGTGRRSSIARSWWNAASRAASSNAPCWATSEPIAAVPCEILPSREFYDYEDKYLLDAAKLIVAGADLTPEQTAESAAAGGRLLSGRGLRRHGARRFPDRDRDRANSTSTRSTPSPASRPSACIRKCGKRRACRTRS